MNAEFFAAIEQLEKEKGIPRDYMLEKVGQALLAAYKRDNAGMVDNVFVEPDVEKKEFRMYVKKNVVEAVENPAEEIALDDAKKVSKKASIGDVVNIDVSTRDFGRIAAQTAKQVIIQGIREAERGVVFREFTSKEHELLTALVTRTDPRGGGASIEIMGNSEKTEVYLSAKEQIPGEVLKEGDRIKIYVVEVKRSERGPQIIISRTHPGLVRRLFEMEVPEISDGTVEIMSTAREAGSRTKIAVSTNDENVDPIGACVGPRGNRVATIVEEIRGEKIDIVKYSENVGEYIAAALAPANVISVDANEEERTCRVIVEDDQLSLAIGKDGQNARLAAKLTGYKIDIKPASSGM
ncbi:MAG: transcription termination/antitermination protein NusA [Oscillospiraceae bacterium]|nr:transcription termination/antitermination protein NusA [Oscillospiraceae bacterium]MBQ6847219.1 transcription termination/antitermination protein NusA [Oscillospiraceae bacterium]MBQ7120116.1 transcription termination/antitermination protein NusA [Oscillospiraceae bacterium]